MAGLTDIYNVVTIQNIDSEDFDFMHNNVAYLVRAGETKNFIKTTAQLAVKHLIDKILERRDPTGKLMVNKLEREKLASQIVLREEDNTRPDVPSDEQLNEKANEISDLDRVIRKGILGQPVEKIEPKKEEEFPEVKPNMKTKAGLIKYAEKELGMTLDEKTRAEFEKMTYLQLKKELGYKEE